MESLWKVGHNFGWAFQIHSSGEPELAAKAREARRSGEFLKFALTLRYDDPLHKTQKPIDAIWSCEKLPGLSETRVNTLRAAWSSWPYFDKWS